MRRLFFLGLLFAPFGVQAQPARRIRPIENGECPIPGCGWKSEPLRVKKVQKCGPSPCGMTEAPGLPGYQFGACNANIICGEEDDQPRTRLIRCGRCSAAFYQDAE